MRKKDNKVYTVNKWNKPLFMDKDEHLFVYGGLTPIVAPAAGSASVTPGIDTLVNSASKGLTHEASKALGQSMAKGAVSGGTKLASTLGSSAASAGIGLAGSIGSTLARHLISDGFQTTAGNLIGDIGGLVGTALNVIPGVGTGVGAIVQAATGVIGGAVNRAFGMKTKQGAIRNNRQAYDYFNDQATTQSSLDDIKDLTSYGFQKPYEGGWLRQGEAGELNADARKQFNDAKTYAQRGQKNSVFNITNDTDDNLLAGIYSDGGLLNLNTANTMNNNDMGAIEYGLVSDLLSNKKMKAEQNNQMTNLFAGTPRTIFDLGGDIQMHGGDYTTGLSHINAGGTHSENPNDGVQMGVDPEGVPNLVEEGETVYENYVFSNRILADEATKQKFHLPKKKDITFAEISKKLEKESSERPNDPISKAGLKAMLSTLADEQERQKQEMEAERAKAAFEALSPEEQTAIMQRAAQEEAIAQQAAQQQAMAEQAAQENAQISPEQAAMLQQQAMQADGSQAAIGQQPQVMAEGGHLFKDGGKKNQGAWKDDKENHWDKFTKPGLLKYIESIKERLDKAGSEKEKNAIRNEAAKEFNALQKSYFENVVPTRGAAHQVFDEGVYSHQGLFDNMFGNTGFYSTDEKGNRKNLIEEAINMPKGHNTDDKPDHWIDGYNGPRTSIRNFGSTEYGDDEFYKTLVDKFKEIGLDYAPNDEWTYDDNELYGLSVPDVAAATRTDEGEPELVVDYGDANGELSGGPAPAGGTGTVVDENGTLVPVKNPTWMRYAGLFGPAVGLGMQLAGVGKPDTSGIDAAIASANSPVHTADWMPIGNYLTYRPFDRLFHSNELLGTSRGTERALLNTNSPSRNAGLLANSYNTMVALGKLAREGEEYNDALEKQVEEFNRGTNMFNAQAYNQNQQFNASERNRARQYGAQTALQGAAQKMDADAGWNNSLYGNVAGLFKGIGDIGNENMAMNWRNALATSGAMGIMDEDLLEQARMAKRVRKTADGGKLKKKKKGLTI